MATCPDMTDADAVRSFDFAGAFKLRQPVATMFKKTLVEVAEAPDADAKIDADLDRTCHAGLDSCDDVLQAATAKLDARSTHVQGLTEVAKAATSDKMLGAALIACIASPLKKAMDEIADEKTHVRKAKAEYAAHGGSGSPSSRPSTADSTASTPVPAPPPAAVAPTPLPAPAPSAPAAASLVAASPQPASFAFIVGIDHYRDVPAASGARSDAQHFAQVAQRTLGLRDEHVRIALDDHATRSDIVAGLDWLKNNVPAGGRVYFFFSGHGAPSPNASTFLLPYDGNPSDVSASAVAMADVMTALGQTKAKEVLAVVDSCFSGAGGRSVLPPGARPLMRVKDTAPAAQMALFTASRGDEISGPAPGEDAGLFTKYVTQALGTGQADMNGDGQITLQELSDWVSPRVARDARTASREQHPNVVVGSGLGSAGNFVVEYGLAPR
jgi:hypothetical protein